MARLCQLWASRMPGPGAIARSLGGALWGRCRQRTYLQEAHECQGPAFSMVTCSKKRKGNKQKRKDHAFRRQFNEKPSVIPGCPGTCKDALLSRTFDWQPCSTHWGIANALALQSAQTAVSKIQLIYPQLFRWHDSWLL